MGGPASSAGAMAKWWGKFIPTRGLVQRTLSPNEHDILKTLVSNAPQKVRVIRVAFFIRRSERARERGREGDRERQREERG